jgi:hypothetical protein
MRFEIDDLVIYFSEEKNVSFSVEKDEDFGLSLLKINSLTICLTIQQTNELCSKITKFRGNTIPKSTLYDFIQARKPRKGLAGTFRYCPNCSTQLKEITKDETGNLWQCPICNERFSHSFNAGVDRVLFELSKLLNLKWKSMESEIKKRFGEPNWKMRKDV